MTATTEPERRCDARIIVRTADGWGDIARCHLPATWAIPLANGLAMLACDRHKRTWVVTGGRRPRRIMSDNEGHGR